jgi:tagatose-6-phosphate ketose/aldose isomerase
MTSSFSNLVLAGLCLRHGKEIEHVLPLVCDAAEQHLPELEALAKRLSTAPVSRVVTLASEPLRALAMEASLKILEMTAGRVATLAETFLGLRHGPMSFLNSDTLVICVLSSDPDRRRYEEDLVSELRQKNLGRLIGITSEKSASDVFDSCVPAIAASCRDELRVPFEIPFAQLLAYHLSLKEGLNPDNPSPMGAITRVVKEFAIYDEKPYV